MGKGDAKRGRGRPRKPGPRHPGGCLVQPRKSKVDLEALERVAFEQGPMQTVLQARRRHMGCDKPGPVSKAEAEALQLAHRGSVLGRWRCDGIISPEQYEAGVAFLSARLAYRQTQGLPPDSPAVALYGAVRGQGAPAAPEVADRARARYTALSAALNDCGPAVRFAFWRAVVQDMPARANLVKIGLDAVKGDVH